MIVVIDNYDSFTYNLVQYMDEVTDSKREVQVFRNDSVTVDYICSLKPQHVVISPGPCTPNEAGISLELVRTCAGRFAILGVCLGHQAIAQSYGAKIRRASAPMHGKTSAIRHNGESIFSTIPNDFIATRYHSLIVERATLPNQLEILATSSDGVIMALRHSEHTGTIGIQFHPESILTAVGKQLLAAFLML